MLLFKRSFQVCHELGNGSTSIEAHFQEASCAVISTGFCWMCENTYLWQVMD
jgi:hypothetical protein